MDNADLINLALTLSQRAPEAAQSPAGRLLVEFSRDGSSTALAIDGGSAEVSATQIHSKDQSWVSPGAGKIQLIREQTSMYFNSRPAAG
jgi:hypothetical protein